MKNSKETKKCIVNEQIDKEYEEHVQTTLTNEAEEESLVEAEQSFSNPPEFNESISIKDRKVHGKKTVMMDQVQVDINPCPEIRKGRHTLPKVKDTIATASYRAGISVPKARVATQTVCEKLYGHIYCLHSPKVDTIDEEDEPSSNFKASDHV